MSSFRMTCMDNRMREITKLSDNYSEVKNIPPLVNCSFVGELGLSGQVRQASNLRAKIDEAIRLGIKNILVPKTSNEIKNSFQKLIQIKEISNINEALNYALKE